MYGPSAGKTEPLFTALNCDPPDRGICGTLWTGWRIIVLPSLGEETVYPVMFVGRSLPDTGVSQRQFHTACGHFHGYM